MAEIELTKDKYITFKCGEEYYGLKIGYVSEIIVYQEFTEIPESADFIKGLINLRGKIIPIIDVRIRFKREPAEYTERTVIIVIDVNDMTVGLIVEKIADVVELGKDDILPSPSIGKNDRSANKFVCGIGKVDGQVKLLLDPLKLIQDVEENTNTNLVTLEGIEDKGKDEGEDGE